MATYNGERYLHQQVVSILENLGDGDELVVSDDHSSDRTREIIESFGDPRIRFVLNSGRRGVNGNFENALREAKGDYIFLADQDDVWSSGKVTACVSALQESLCVVHDAWLTDADLNASGTFFESYNCKTGFWHNWIRNGYLGCAMAFRRELLKRALPIPENFPVYHDIWLGSIAQLSGGVTFLGDKLLKFRRHSTTTSITNKGTYSLIKKITYRIKILTCIMQRKIELNNTHKRPSYE